MGIAREGISFFGSIYVAYFVYALWRRCHAGVEQKNRCTMAQGLFAYSAPTDFR